MNRRHIVERPALDCKTLTSQAYTSAVRRLWLLLVLGCGSGDEAVAPRTFEFGPFDLAPGQEISSRCVSATLDNDEPLFINSVELTAGVGFHHSNWFWVPEDMYAGPDGDWRCGERDYDEAVAGLLGGVLFAQSTQAQHEIQAFDAGVAIVIPPRSKIVAGTHLLNPSDEARSVPLTMTMTPIANPTTKLHGMAIQNQGLLLPARRSSRFTIECPLAEAFDNLGYDRDYNMHYVLPHYHERGIGITLEAVDAAGTVTTIFANTARVGEPLGSSLAPVFPMRDVEKLRFSCNYDNQSDTAIGWGNGDGEMCIFLAFQDSPHEIAGGVLSFEPPESEVDQGDFVEFTHLCDVIVSEPRE
jgi:hypothetical protein